MRRGLRRKLGRSGFAVAIIGLVALGAAVILEGRAGGEEAQALAELVQARAVDPVELVVRGAGNRRVIVIGDVPGSAAPKLLTQRVLRRLTEGGTRVDALVVGADSSHQSALDRYMATAPEDASILLREQGLVTGAEGRHLLELFRAVYQLNEELGADRRIRILAVASEPWPPLASLAPGEAAERFARRGERMAERLRAVLLDRSSSSRAVVLVDALQALSGGYGIVEGGGAGSLEAHWLAARLRQQYPIDVYSVLPDGPFGGGAYSTVARYTGTTLYPRMQRIAGSGAFGLPIVEPIAGVRRPLRVQSGTGLSLQLMPPDYRLADVTNGYVYFSSDAAGQ